MRARRLTVCGPQRRDSTPCRARSTVSIGEPLSRPPRTSMLDEHRPERPVLLAVNQEFGEGPLPLNVPEGYKQQARRFAPGSCLTERRSPRLAW